MKTGNCRSFNTPSACGGVVYLENSLLIYKFCNFSARLFIKRVLIPGRPLRVYLKIIAKIHSRLCILKVSAGKGEYLFNFRLN